MILLRYCAMIMEQLIDPGKSNLPGKQRSKAAADFIICGCLNMDIAFFGDSLTAGKPGASYYRMLCRMLPEYRLHNYGHGGDSVIGAFDLVSRLQLQAPFDISFVWIGTNDVFPKVSWTFPLVRRFMGLPWTRSPREFENVYGLLLDELCFRSRVIYTVSPWFVGENLENDWNGELEELAGIVQALSANHGHTTYLDLRALVRSELNNGSVSSYVPRSALTVAWDVLRLKGKTAVDQKAAQRGLKYTLDGVHLNSEGAKMVAEHLARIIKKTPAKQLP